MLSNEQLLLEYVADIVFKMIKEHPELCPHDYRWTDSATNNEGEKVERYKCNLCDKKDERTRASLLGKNEEAHINFLEG